VTWLLGSAVAAYYATDDMYYRAKIVGFDDDGIEVSLGILPLLIGVLGKCFSNSHVCTRENWGPDCQKS